MRWVCTASADCCLRRRVTEMIIIMMLCGCLAPTGYTRLYHVARCKQNASPPGGRPGPVACVSCVVCLCEACLLWYGKDPSD